LNDTYSVNNNQRLLIKCRESIENLHVEIEDERKLRRDIQKDLVNKENSYNELQRQYKEQNIEFNRINEELLSMQNILQQYKSKLSELT